MRILESSYAGFESRPEYNDIEFIERSQYVEELLPSITDLEDVLPTQEEIDYFTNEILDPKIYGLRSKPERVFGGYYIRGFNTIQGDRANDKLVERLRGKLEASKLSGKIQFFFIPDPKALTDEEIDMGEENEPVLLVTGVDPSLLYRQLNIFKKVGVSAAGLLTLLIFALGSGELNNAVVPPFGQAFLLENADDVVRISNNALPIGLSLAGIHAVHEGAHRLVAWKDKFKVGLPNVVPSLQLGVTGTITPLESPPPNFNSF
ncbi:response to high light intensity [Fragilaria crotonensis]|nr:response to high light intensity [Fragilaria crotonensis]